jgi:hypothetical protein
MDLSAIGLQGLQQADLQLEAAASALARASAAPAGANFDVADFASQIVALNSAQDSFALNLATLKTANQVHERVLNLFV